MGDAADMITSGLIDGQTGEYTGKGLGEICNQEKTNKRKKVTTDTVKIRVCDLEHMINLIQKSGPIHFAIGMRNKYLMEKLDEI